MTLRVGWMRRMLLAGRAGQMVGVFGVTGPVVGVFGAAGVLWRGRVRG
jgi:hypothetical protein